MEIAHVHAGGGVTNPCPNCLREFGPERSCRWCGQVDSFPVGIQLSSAGKRLGGYMIDGLLFWFTLIIPYIIWSLIVWGRGQTPGKQILGMRCVKFDEVQKASWATMFLREFVYKGLLFFVIIGTTLIGWVLYFWLLWDKNNQELWDKMAGTIVVDDPKKLFTGDAPLAAPPTTLAPSESIPSTLP